MNEIRQQVQEATDRVRTVWSGRPVIGIVLGTGLGGLADRIDADIRIPYCEIPHFPDATAPSHAGHLVCGSMHGVPLVAMEGRFHYYEGYTLQQVTFPVRLMKALGAEILILTSAVGGMNPDFRLSDVVIIEDHINLMPDNPLRGVNDDSLGPRFPDMSEPYDHELISLATTTAGNLDIAVQTGTLVAVPGPNLETRAEYRMLRLIGADVVGMSTVPEVIVANHAGLRAIAFSIVTDMCLPELLEPVAIEKILKVAAEGGARLERLLSELIRRLG
ncbi:MAG: purine-nucleoside phosphorylase [Planctomycetaceae bacterium]